jgi:hypothetical protein
MGPRNQEVFERGCSICGRQSDAAAPAFHRLFAENVWRLQAHDLVARPASGAAKIMDSVRHARNSLSAPLSPLLNTARRAGLQAAAQRTVGSGLVRISAYSGENPAISPPAARSIPQPALWDHAAKDTTRPAGAGRVDRNGAGVDGGRTRRPTGTEIGAISILRFSSCRPWSCRHRCRWR